MANSLTQLSADHCILLAATYASESNLDGLHILLRSRSDAFRPELALRILLTYLPETVDPSLYTAVVAGVAGLPQAENTLPTIELDTSSVADLTDSKAHKQAKHLHLLALDHPSCPASLCDDLVTRFLVHRAHRVADAGILTFVPELLDPFLDDRPLLKTWFISNVLPLLRLNYEYYTEDEATCTLDQLETASGEQAVDLLLSKSLQSKTGENGTSILARDLQFLVGPWMYGANDRKRRKLSGRRERQLSEYSADSRRYGNELEDELDHDQKIAETETQWDSALTWLARAASKHFPAVAEAVEIWDGPGHVDLGGYDRNSYLDDDLQGKLEIRYAQTVFAAIYAADTGSREAISSAHSLLVRIANLMELDPPPGLATSVEMLPGVDDRKSILQELTSSVLQTDALLEQKHPLTYPSKDSFALLQLFVFSSYILLDLNNPLSIVAVAKIRFQYDADEQIGVVTRILHSLTTTSKRDEEGWAGVRLRLIWLWGWAIHQEEDGDELGHGIFGKVERGALEKEILKALVNTGSYSLVAKTYIQGLDPQTDLTIKDVENVIISTALHHYDNASNGNRTRGGVKKAADVIAAFKRHFPTSDAFKRSEALLAATHALSFYSLTLQHGVPFQPVNIRVSSDPVSLIEKVLSQNPRSYTKLDDLISIATNLVASGAGQEVDDDVPAKHISPSQLANAKRKAERRVIGMAIEAALTEDDFETAYSYVVNRLTSSNSQGDRREIDDISWRAALAAGRHKSSTLSSSTNLATPPKLRRLEQRMELLSQTLLLAPPNALPEVLNVWRKCEEEMTVLQAAESAEDDAFNQRAEQGVPGAFVNTTAPVQPRREVGRGGHEEAPMGLFDVARGAAAAFGRTAFPLRGAATAQGEGDSNNRGHTRNVSSAGASDAGEGEHRVRRRDMVANAVTGGLASGIGWVIGATPSDRPQR